MSLGRRLRRSLRYMALRGLLWPLEVMPRRWALGLGESLGSLAWRGLPRHRIRAEDNLERAGFGPRERAHELSKRCFCSLGRNAVDFLRLRRTDGSILDRIVTVEGEEHLFGAYRRGRGVVVATGHIGNWELLASYFVHRGLPIHVIARPLRDERFDRFVQRSRQRCGVRCLSRDLTLTRAVKLLREGVVLGILCDQNTAGAGFDIPFFGHPAFTPVGTAALCRLSGAALVPMAIQIQPEGSHHISILPEIDQPRTEDREEDLRRTMVLINEALETLIRRAPEQWVWFHERWGKKRSSKASHRAGHRARGVSHGVRRGGIRSAGADSPRNNRRAEFSES